MHYQILPHSKSDILEYRVKTTENVLPSKFLWTALYVQSRSAEMKSGAGEDGWCEVMNRGEFSSVWVIMGGEVVGKQPSCVNNEGGTAKRGAITKQSVNYQVTAARRRNGKFQYALAYREAGETARGKDELRLISTTWKQRAHEQHKKHSAQTSLLTPGR